MANSIDYKKYYDKKDEMLDYIKKNKEKYQREVSRYIEFMIATNNAIHYSGPLATCLQEILSKFDVLKDDMDFYKLFYKMLQNYSLLEGNCCEVASGEYPRLAELIYPTIERNNSSLVIYEPNLTISRLGKAKLVKENFTKDTDISNIDTIFGIFPCEATIPMVEKALEEDKNLLIALCDCDHTTLKYPNIFGKFWANDFCDIIKKEYSDVEFLSWPQELEQPTPIMLRRSSKNR